MTVTTRKRKAPFAKLPAAVDLKHPTSSTKAKSNRVDFKDDDPFYDAFAESSDTNIESEVSDYASRKQRKKGPKMKKRKTKKSSPGPAPSAPEISDVESESDQDDSMWSTSTFVGRSSVSSAAPSNVLSIKLDTGATSPTVLNLDLSKIMHKGLAEIDLRSPSTLASPIAATSLISDNAASDEANFLSLPRELRDKIYKLVLAAPSAIVFHRRENFKRSAQMLRTCKTVAEEGARVLYGMNAFHFERTAERRGTYYDLEWKEVGFKDVRRFLRDIGPTNISYMRYISFTLDEAAAYLTPYVASYLERLFVNDAVLQEIFRMIGKNTVLNKLAIEFCSRAQVTAKDFHFLRALGEMKCKKFYHHNTRYNAGRINDQALNTLKSVIVLNDLTANVDLDNVKHVSMALEKPRKAKFEKQA